jgi:hypothetical protein
MKLFLLLASSPMVVESGWAGDLWARITGAPGPKTHWDEHFNKNIFGQKNCGCYQHQEGADKGKWDCAVVRLAKCMAGGPGTAAIAGKTDQYCLSTKGFPGSYVCAKMTQEFVNYNKLQDSEHNGVGHYSCIWTGMWSWTSTQNNPDPVNHEPKDSPQREYTLEIWGEATHQCAWSFLNNDLGDEHRAKDFYKNKEYVIETRGIPFGCGFPGGAVYQVTNPVTAAVPEACTAAEPLLKHRHYKIEACHPQYRGEQDRNF